MAEKKKLKRKAPVQKQEEVSPAVACHDALCPVHGSTKLKMRGRVFEGTVIRKQLKRVTIQFERMIKLSKYERYEKRRTKLHARLPDCMGEEVAIGDFIRVAETRPISKMIHFVVSGVVRKGEVGA